MTKEELALKHIREVKGLTSQWSDKEIKKEYEDYFDGYIASAEPREKQIQIDAEQIRALQKQNGELTDKVKKLEARNEKMKNCGNCRFSESDKLNGTFCHREGCFVVANAKCKLWEN